MWFPGNGEPLLKGETSDQYFLQLGAFEVKKFKFDIKGDESTEQKGPGNSGKAKFGDFTIEKVVDTASIPLYKALCRATIFPSIMLAVRKAGGSNLLFLQYIFRYNQITSIDWEGGTGTERPSESVTFSFKAMGVQYIAQSPSGGKQPGPPQTWSWNIADQGSPSLEVDGLDGAAPAFLKGIPK
ncbi:MAG TPA: type VI secretion system tube protein Hcp [Bryobacteraceae bacterium]|nr:type VI secretion system tube protein Hcp [Bryobacteraceae bacterium]